MGLERFEVQILLPFCYTRMIMEDRRVLAECSILGDLSLSWSIFILLILGFLAGVASTSLFVYLRRRKQLSYEIEYREKCNEGTLSGDPRELILSSSSLHQRLSHPTPGTKLNIISPTPTKPPTLWVEKNEEINISTNPLRDSIAYCSTIMTLPSPMRDQHTSREDGPFDLVIHDNPAASISPLSSSSSLKQQPIPLYNPETNKVNNKHKKEEDSSPCGEADDAPLGSGRRTALLAAALKQQQFSSSSSQETEAAAVMAISIKVKKDVSEAESLEHITSSMHSHHDDHDQAHGTDGGDIEGKDTIVLIPAQGKDDLERDKEGEGVDDYINPFLQSPTEEEKKEDTIHTATAITAAAVYNTNNDLESASHIQQPSTNSDTSGSSSAAVKSKKAAMITKDKYEIEELGDAGWKGILGQLDTLLHSQGLPTLSADERPVAIRSLVVSTVSEDVAVALQRAATDVGMCRKTKQFVNNGE